MIAVDTNVLLRLVVGDEPAQAARARRYLEANASAATPCFLNRAVLCELAWVLKSSYGYGREDIAAIIERLLHTAELRIEDPDVAGAALDAHRAGHDFADVYIAASNRLRGCDVTVTFDRRAARLPLFALM